MYLKKYFLWILLFGSLIGLHESLTGSFDMPHRSVIMSTITLALLSVARIKIQKPGTTLLIMLVAVLFKINNTGVYNCTANELLCGPTAMMLLGINFEILASLLLSKNTSTYSRLILVCGITALLSFSLFGLMNTYILHSWDISRLSEYIFIKAVLTAILSGILGSLALFTARNIKISVFPSNKPYLLNGILSCLVVALWILGTNMKF